MQKIVFLPCTTCGTPMKPEDRWTFPRYIARLWECPQCKSKIETHEKPVSYDPSRDMSGKADVGGELVPVHPHIVPATQGAQPFVQPTEAQIDAELAQLLEEARQQE